jgi:hypothetical protein
VESLAARGVHAKIVEVNDNNDIDREVTAFKANIVVIEALWVVPSKFNELKPLHPKVKWFVHLHSHIPFLALEGIAMEWLDEYGEKGIGLIANSLPSYKAFKSVLRHDGLIYLPNVYITNPKEPKPYNKHGTHVDIGCFGAIRPLKNQLLQAMAAIQYSKEIGKTLRFHINASRVETMGSPVLKNMLELFARTKHTQLIQHAWHEPEEFIRQLEMKIDIGMQVSLTETFCVVAADVVTAGVPLVASKEVYWASRFSKCSDNEIEKIVRYLHVAQKYPCLISHNQKLLKNHEIMATQSWFDFVRGGL